MLYKFRNPDGSYNMVFNDVTGFSARWGRTEEEDPQRFFPELMDVEISSICGRGCNFCVPEGGMITTIMGDKKIESLKAGDMVLSHRQDKTVVNDIKETYIRDYEGELVVIVLENGKELKLTPDHKILVMERGWIMAKNIKEEDVLVTTF